MMSKHEVNKDALCVVVMPKMGLVYIPVCHQKKRFGENLQKVRKQSNTECKHKQINMLAFQNN